MKQKIVIRVCSSTMCCGKCRCKAMKVAASMSGVESVALDGKSKDEVVVVGDCVDSVKLATALRKKMRHAHLLQVSEVKKADDKKPPPAPPSNPPPPPQPVTFACHHCHCHPAVGYVNYSCYCYCHCRVSAAPAAAPPSNPPPPPATACQHCHCHPAVGYVNYSCYCYCHCH